MKLNSIALPSIPIDTLNDSEILKRFIKRFVQCSVDIIQLIIF